MRASLSLFVVVACTGDPPIPSPAPAPAAAPAPAPAATPAPPPPLKVPGCTLEFTAPDGFPDMSWKPCPETPAGTCERVRLPEANSYALDGRGVATIGRQGRLTVLTGWTGPLAALSLRSDTERASCDVMPGAHGDRGLALTVVHTRHDAPTDAMPEVTLVVGPDPWRLAGHWSTEDPRRPAAILPLGAGWVVAGQLDGLSHIGAAVRPLVTGAASYRDLVADGDAVLAVEDDKGPRLVRISLTDPPRREVLFEPPVPARLTLAGVGRDLALFLTTPDGAELLTADPPPPGRPLAPTRHVRVPVPDGFQGASLVPDPDRVLVHLAVVGPEHHSQSDFRDSFLIYDATDAPPRSFTAVPGPLYGLGAHEGRYYGYNHDGDMPSLRRYDLAALARVAPVLADSPAAPAPARKTSASARAP